MGTILGFIAAGTVLFMLASDDASDAVETLCKVVGMVFILFCLAPVPM